MTHRVKAAVHRTTWSVFVYIKLGTEVGEGGERVENKVKRKPTCRQRKSILMSKLRNSVTNNKKGSLSRGELTAKVNSLGVALRTEDDLNKRGKILNLRSLNALYVIRESGRQTTKHISAVC